MEKQRPEWQEIYIRANTVALVILVVGNIIGALAVWWLG